MKLNNSFVAVFSQSNYCINTSGTEKVTRNLQNLYNQKGISYLHFFPIATLNNIIGVNLDGKFIGIYNEKDIGNLIRKYNQKAICRGIIIQHLRGFDLKLITKALKELNMQIILAIHDFYYICNTFNFLKNKKSFCGITTPCAKKCKGCHNYPTILEFQNNINLLFISLKGLINKVIFPSDFCKEMWLGFFPYFRKKTVVRPHLTYENTGKPKTCASKIKIAYIGRKNKYKGFDLWNKITNEQELRDKYDFYYFGVDTEKDSNVIEVYTTNANGCETIMQDNMKKYGIDVTLLWSIIPETYSFTYYEASTSKTIVLTNTQSGNIYKQVEKNKNGFIFKDEEELIHFLKNNEDKIREKIEHNPFIPEKMIPNQNLEDYIINTEYTAKNNKVKKVKKKILYTILYKLKNIERK